MSLSVCPGVGNRTSSTQMPGGVPGGEMVTGRIEPRITTWCRQVYFGGEGWGVGVKGGGGVRGEF